MKAKTERTCTKGHKYFKSSDCPVCPICENERLKNTGFWVGLGAPAKRALESAGITSIEILSQYSETELSKLHGLGKNGIEKLRNTLNINGLQFSQK